MRISDWSSDVCSSDLAEDELLQRREPRAMINFFISRPVFAWVLAIVTMLAGIMAIFVLPIQQYPSVAPPAVEIQADYPGASADIVSNTVVQVIEQEMTGLDNLLYMSSTADSSGHATDRTSTRLNSSH